MIDAIPPEALLAAYPRPMGEIAETFRGIVRRALPDAIERVRPGWRVLGYDVPAGSLLDPGAVPPGVDPTPVGGGGPLVRRAPSAGRTPPAGRASMRRRTVYFCWIMPEAMHVHLGFVYGILMDDPDRLLEGQIPRARWVTRVPGEDIDEARLTWLVREAARVALLSPAERLAASLDRELRGRPGD